MAENRKLIDCRRFPAEKPCSIVISGTEDDVLDLAALHAQTVHGHRIPLNRASRSALCFKMKAASQPKRHSRRPKWRKGA